MQIEWLPGDGRRLAAQLPYTNAECVIVKSDCPVCTGKCVLVAHDIRETAIFSEVSRKKATRALREAGADLELVDELALPMPGEFRIRGIRPQVGEYEAEATAICFRCRSKIGRLVVTFATMWGITEDAMVRRRLRVY